MANAQSLRKEIEKMNSVVQACMMKKDIAGFKKACQGGMTADFKYVEAGKKGKPMNFDQMVAMMKMGFDQMGKINSVKTVIHSVKEKGNTGVCKSTHSFSGIMLMPGKDGKMTKHTMSEEGDVTETYVKVGGKWKMSSMTWENDRAKLDGKPFSMDAAAGGK